MYSPDHPGRQASDRTGTRQPGSGKLDEPFVLGESVNSTRPYPPNWPPHEVCVQMLENARNILDRWVYASTDETRHGAEMDLLRVHEALGQQLSSKLADR